MLAPMSPTVTLTRPAGHAPPPDLAGSTADGLLVLVAPCNGRFQPVVTGGVVGTTEAVARITTGRGGSQDVASPVRADVQGLLTRPGQLVTKGQALAWARVLPAVA